MPRCGLTFLELVLAAAVTGMLVIGLGSALSISARSLRPSGAAPGTVAATAALRQLQEDLRFATDVLSHSATSVRVVTTDADEDGDADIVTWQWSGTPGDDVMRQVDEGPVVPACASATDFDLTFPTTAVPLSLPGAAVASEPATLDWYRGPLTVTSHTVGEEDHYGQWIHPEQFPAETRLAADQEWQPTALHAWVARSGSGSGGSAVQIDVSRASGDGRPTSDLLRSVQVDPAVFSSLGSWETLVLPNAPWLSADEGICVTLTFLSGDTRAVVQSGSPANGGWFVSDVSTGAWTAPDARRALQLSVSGRVRTRPRLAVPQHRSRHDRVEIRLETTDTAGRPLYAATELLNRPWQQSLFARSSFDTDPTAEDCNGDGTGDWTLAVTGASGHSSRSGGLWSAKNRSLSLKTVLPRGQVLEIQTRFRATESAGDGAVVRGSVVSSDGTGTLAFRVRLAGESDGTQTLLIEHEQSTDSYARIARFASLDSGLQTMRITADPDLQTLGVWVGPVLMGSFHLPDSSTTAVPSIVQLQSPDCASEFDFVHVAQF